ncbi:MAG TPA: glycosyltransferase family 39 protein, partial [Dissulfurispiraceae bacterium]|nr:glycosyltransferase family 39 protein [Dissulfurispiraceae bacterium]
MKKFMQFVVIIILTVLTVSVLYYFRNLDDNRLVSWEWVFGTIKITRILTLLVPGSIVAYMFSKSPVPDRYPVPFLFILSFAAASLFWREPEVIVDASRYFTQAKHLELYGTGYFLREWGKTIQVWTDLPLMPFIYGLVFRFLGEARIYVQLVTTLLFSFTVVLTYIIGKTLWDKETGFSGAMFLLGIPYMFTQAPLMLVDIPTMFFITFAVFAFITALERGGIWTPVASAALFMVICSKYSAWLMFSLLIIIAVMRLLQVRRSSGEIPVRNCILRIIIPVLSSALAAGAVMFLKHDVFFSQIRLLLSYQKPGLTRWGESFISTFLFQVHPFISAAAAFSLYGAWKKKDPKYLIISWFMILIFALQIKRIRYTIIAFPMLALMAAYGTRVIRDIGLKRQIVFSVATCSITIAVFAYLPFLQQTSAQNLQCSGAFINSLPGKNIEVVTLPKKGDDVNIAVSVPLLDLFV